MLVGLVAISCVVATGCSSHQTRQPSGTAAPRPATASIAPPSESSGLPQTPPVTGMNSPVTAPRFPPVAALGWLAGVSAEPAIRVPEDGFVRWQGAEPGEQAELLPDGGYRWVGPDGSMVGCVAPPAAGRRHLKCVGVDGAGDTAITDGASGPRAVYGADGGFLGQYDSSGARVVTNRAPSPLGEAIAASGVDMASLVDFATRQQPFAGGIAGDPHLITAGGIRVSTQRSGDFEARAGDPAHLIQIRTEAMPYQTDVSYVTAAAVGVPGHRIEVSLSGRVSVDGTAMGPSGTFQQISLSDGPTLGVWPPDADGVVDATVLWPDGATVSMTADSSLGLTVTARLPRSPAAGLFGAATPANAGGVSTPTASSLPTPDLPGALARGDFLARSGASGSVSVDQVIDSWRVAPGQSLLSGPAPVLQPSVSPAAISAAAMSAAEKSCAAGKMDGVEDLAACIFDVARTGDDGYVVRDGALAVAATPSKVPARLAATWPALVLGPSGSPAALELGSQVDGIVAAGSRRLYRLTLGASERLTIAMPACGKGGDGALPQGGAALRLFDGLGTAVSARQALCGTSLTDQLAAGTYYLVVAGPTAGPNASFRVRVS